MSLMCVFFCRRSSCFRRSPEIFTSPYSVKMVMSSAPRPTLFLYAFKSSASTLLPFKRYLPTRTVWTVPFFLLTGRFKYLSLNFDGVTIPYPHVLLPLDTEESLQSGNRDECSHQNGSFRATELAVRS